MAASLVFASLVFASLVFASLVFASLVFAWVALAELAECDHFDAKAKLVAPGRSNPPNTGNLRCARCSRMILQKFFCNEVKARWQSHFQPSHYQKTHAETDCVCIAWSAILLASNIKNQEPCVARKLAMVAAFTVASTTNFVIAGVLRYEESNVNPRFGLTLVELIVVLAIIAVLLGLLFPAVQLVRERARETVCKNNVYQINLATLQFQEVHKKLPRPGRIGKIGGWIVDILPFIEQQNLHSAIKQNADVATAPESLLSPPSIFQCPRSLILDSTPPDKMQRGHYTLVTLDNRKFLAGIYDSPVDLKVDWVTGPEMDYHAIQAAKGPHHDGFHFSSGSPQGISFMLNGEDIR